MLRYNTPKNLVDNIDRLKDIGGYRRPMTRKPYWETEILEKHKHPIYITSEDINSNLDGFILCFSFLYIQFTTTKFK